MTTPKLCKDCAHAAKAGAWYCRKAVDLVTGDGIECHIVRDDDTKCGPDGQWYEKRFDPTDSATFVPISETGYKSAIETPKATIRKESDRPWENPKDYEPDA